MIQSARIGQYAPARSHMVRHALLILEVLASAEGVFAPYSALDKYCAIVPLSHSYINYSPDGAPLPYTM
jgi:hypothetical protein